MTKEKGEKMPRDEALEILKAIYFIDEKKQKALNMAIEALEREGKKCGEWIQHVNEPSLWSCSICETVIYSEHEEDRLKFHKWCGCCGADMRERREDAEKID